jgi:hypothetical protein
MDEKVTFEESGPVKGIVDEPCLIGENGVVPIRDIKGLCFGGGGEFCPVPYWVGAYTGDASIRIGTVEDAEHGRQAIANILVQCRAALRLSKEGRPHDLTPALVIPAKQ